jgi:hypothetical protein
MMHAMILEAPAQSRAHSNEQLAGRAIQLSSADRDYYRRRKIQEYEAAARASCCEARFAHEELAAAYRQFCRSNEAPIDPACISSSPI